MKRTRRVLKKYFIPHEENNHKPHILRARSVIFVLIIALVAEGLLWFGTTELAPHSELFGVIVVNALVDETNQSRVANGDATLAVSPLLMAAAQEKVDDMVANNYFAHTSPSGLTPWYWFAQVGYNFTYAGENLAVNFSDSQDVTNAWMNSAEHRANILNADFTQIGMAAATGTYEGHPAVYVVELFGAPAPAAPPAEAPLGLINAAAAASPSLAPAPVAGASSGVVIEKQKNISTSSLAAVPMVTTTSTSQADIYDQTSTSAAAATEAVTGTPPAMPVTAGATVKAAPQSNPIQKAASNPRQVVDYLYLAIIALFALALCLNIFIKIRIQHPRVIFGGMLVILVAGLLIVLNQHMFGGAAIL